MVNSTVCVIVDLAINAEKFDQFESLAQTMVAGSQREPGTLGYDWYLSADRTRCRLIETYANADALLAHFTGPVVQELVPKVLQASSVTAFEVYGDPGAKAAQMLAGFGAQVFAAWHRLSR